jgi:U6 snRNA-associated Sm-like protein LSm2
VSTFPSISFGRSGSKGVANWRVKTYSFFKTLTNHVVTVELKNDIRIRGTLKSVDQYLNIKLDDVDVLDLDKYPHLSSVKNMFIRGSVVRYVVLPQSEVDRGLLEDATRRGGFFISRLYANSLNFFDLEMRLFQFYVARIQTCQSAWKC